MSGPRHPAVAGRFYPGRAADLAATVDDLLDAAPVPEADGRPVALLVPHAGYQCSGAVAASAYRMLADTSPIRTVAVLGPAHFLPPHGLAVPECSAWSTPLGDVPVDEALCARLANANIAHRDDRPHAREHSIEVQIPFLQRLLGDGWTLVPVVARSEPPDTIADGIDELVDDDVLVVVSSDLSHYYDEPTARRLDARTATAIVGRDPAGVGDRDACGAGVIRGLLTWAVRHDLTVEQLGRATSADTCSGPDRVVGYGAFAIRRPEPVRA
jgi:AmmeMemoRadiSam system protein B